MPLLQALPITIGIHPAIHPQNQQPALFLVLSSCKVGCCYRRDFLMHVLKGQWTRHWSPELSSLFTEFPARWTFPGNLDFSFKAKGYIVACQTDKGQSRPQDILQIERDLLINILYGQFCCQILIYNMQHCLLCCYSKYLWKRTYWNEIIVLVPLWIHTHRDSYIENVLVIWCKNKLLGTWDKMELFLTRSSHSLGRVVNTGEKHISSSTWN